MVAPYQPARAIYARQFGDVARKYGLIKLETAKSEWLLVGQF
ncbi:hypothetical protein FIU95_07610 [Microbulbifer sp. THAF38]|nr:hypothetical protein FIU95_07610 [Microbulbifer sp. THAF38]